MGIALITPFKADMSVDYEALLRLVEYQVIPSYVTVVINDKISATN